MLSKKIVTAAVTAISVISLGVARDAFAVSYTDLGGGNWAVNCANGKAFSYSGTSAGLDTIGPALCPDGRVSANPVGGGKLGLGTSIKPSTILGDAIRVEDSLPTGTTPGVPNKLLIPTGVVLPKGVTRGIPANVDLAILQNRKEVGEPGMQSVVQSYPPKGYPCLGCHPCAGNTTEFCDDKTNARVVILPVGWTPVITNSTKGKYLMYFQS
jgi:hypothetical protein